MERKKRIVADRLPKRTNKNMNIRLLQRKLFKRYWNRDEQILNKLKNKNKAVWTKIELKLMAECFYLRGWYDAEK